MELVYKEDTKGNIKKGQSTKTKTQQIANIKCMYTNADTLTNKMPELKALVKDIQPSVIAITEVIPKNYRYPVQKAEIKISEDYNIFPECISNMGRGITIQLHKSIEAQEVNIQTTFEESIWCEGKLEGNDRLLIGCIYRSESGTTENNNKLRELIRKISTLGYSHVLIMGDFNYKDIKWENWSTPGCNESSDEFLFVEALRDSFFHQHIVQPTRVRHGQEPSVLDLVLTNEEGMIENIEYGNPLGKSDHLVLTFEFKCYTKQNTKEKNIQIYAKGKYDLMREELKKVNWEAVLQEREADVNKQWDYIKERILEAANKYIPKRRIKKDRPNRNQINSEMRQLIKKKHRLWQRYRESNYNDDEKYRHYCRVRNKVRKATRYQQRCQEKEIADNAKSNPKKFWQYINQRTKTSTGIADLENITTNRLTSNDKEKAEVLATFFSSVFTQERTQEMPTIQKGKLKGEISYCNINREDVQKKLKNLNPNKSPGPDKLHSRILKELYSVLDKPLAILFQNTLKKGKLPDEWKHAIVTAIFKKGDKRKPNNYRPVSLTCIICKIIESIIRDKIMEHMENNNLFSNKQFGFLNGRSTVLQLLTVLDKWTKIIDEGGTIDCVYFDFKKAFDKVPHQRLIHKAEQYGIKGDIINWIKSFLDSRTQQVVINGELSEPKNVTSGIPQGSVLGPLLFVIFINDLPDQVKSDMFLFADDTKIFRRISTKQDEVILQEDINEMVKWADQWQLEFHPDKCVKMSINNKELENRTYNMDDVILRNVKQEKDIGVIVDDQLKFEDHMYEKIKKANNMMGLIRRSFIHLDEEMFLKLYKALVRPHLEYANVIWHPTKIKDITAIENVQR